MSDLPQPDEVSATNATQRKDAVGIITPARIPGQVLPPAGDTFSRAADHAPDPAPARQFPRQPPRLLVLVDFPRPVHREPVRRVHRQLTGRC